MPEDEGFADCNGIYSFGSMLMDPNEREEVIQTTEINLETMTTSAMLVLLAILC